MNGHRLGVKAGYKKQASYFLPLVSCSLTDKRDMENALDIDRKLRRWMDFWFKGGWID